MSSFLDENDLKKINIFSTLLFNDLINIETNVLNLLSDFFSFNTCSFVSSDRNYEPIKIIGHNVSSEDILAYQKKYLESDIFRDFLKKSRKSNSSCDENADIAVKDCIPKSIVSIEEIISSKDFEKHYYNEFLSSQNLRYEIDINLSNNNNGNHYSISIFKSHEEGPFSEKEKHLLNYIYHVINANFSRYLFMMSHTENDMFLQTTLDNLPFGLAIYDENFEIIRSNSQANSYMCSITSSSNSQTGMLKFTDLIFKNTNTSSSFESSSVPLDFGSHSVTISPSISFMNQGKVLKCYYVYIRENESIAFPDEKTEIMMLNKIDLISKYGLTVREIDIVQLLYSGKSNKEISESLFISVNTLKSHLSNIYRKLEVSNKVEAILLLSS